MQVGDRVRVAAFREKGFEGTVTELDGVRYAMVQWDGELDPWLEEVAKLEKVQE